MKTPKEIREEIGRLEEMLKEAQEECPHERFNVEYSGELGKYFEIKECVRCGVEVTTEVECRHPDAEKTYHGDSGNYDPNDDRYWYEFYCPDCGKRWTEDQ